MEQWQRKIVLFYSYHPSDDILRDQLAQFLRPLVRNADVKEWSDQQSLLAGDNIEEKRADAWESATHILLLLSTAYLASEVCYQEMQHALERQKNGEAYVIPIRLHPFLSTRELEASLPSCLPENGRPVSTWKKREEALFDVARGICQILGLPLATLRHHPSSDRNRDYLLDQVFACWIEGVLEPSLQGRMPLALPWKEQPDALANPDALVNPWRDEVQELKRIFRPLSTGMSIIQVYDDANGELLILGEPGAGKTTLLLELTHMLLKRAEKEHGARVPVVFPLSSWAREKQPLDTWFVEELVTRYQIPRKAGKHWIDDNAILPLLDGLDEVTEPARAACVRAIREYHAGVQRELVVCCRREEYFALPGRLALRRAVCIQQLTDNQIEHYLQQAEQNTDQQLRGLRQVLLEDRELNELAHQPLMLNIFTLAYQGVTAAEIPTEPTEAKSRTVFSRYLDQMLNRRGLPRTGTPEQVRQWLTFIAKQLCRDQQTLLTVEYLQPDWLSGRPRRLYWWNVRLFTGLATWVLFELLLGALFGVFGVLSGHLISSLFTGLFLGLVFGVEVGIVTGLLAKRTSGLPIKEVDSIPLVEVSNWLWINGLLYGLLCGVGSGLTLVLLYGYGWLIGLPVGLLAGLLTWQASRLINKRVNQQPAKRWSNGLLNGLLCGLGAGLVLGQPKGLAIGLFSGLLATSLAKWPARQGAKRDASIRPAERFNWSWKNAFRFGLPTGLGFGVAIGLPFWQIFGLIAGLLAGLAALLFSGLFNGMVAGLAPDRLAERTNLSPNEGIRLSGKRGLLLGLVYGLLVGLTIGLSVGIPVGLRLGLAFGWVAGLTIGLLAGLFVGLLMGLLAGLNAFIQHLVLRFWLWRTNCLPWDRELIPFLDEATERLLLRKAGGSYLFIHRTLQDYIAGIENDQPSTETEERG